ncbi:MAG: hypothetical protein IJ639_04645 [Ruminococcus sp.]|nr:hypothetical protein [Ruminococcus sp.]
MKRFFPLLLCAMLCIGITGCSKESNSIETQFSDKNSITKSTVETSENSKTASDEQSDTKETVKNMIEVNDKDGKHIGQIPFNSGMTLTNNGIFYTTSIPSSASSDTIAVGINEGEKERIVYHLYDIKTDESFTFGSIPDQDYEAGYCRTELDGKLYILVTVGNAMDKEPDALLLAEFDLIEHTINQYKISDNGFPYTAMAEVNGKLLILNHDQTDVLNDKLYLFDPESKQTKQVMQFELNGNFGDTIRSMNSDGKNIYILRLHFEGNNNVAMFLDKFDLDFKKLSEKDISAMLKESAGENLVPEDVANEMKQMVSRFMVLDGKYVYYENFSTTRFLGNIEDGKLFNETEGVGDMFLASSGSGKPFFYCIFGGEKNENSIFEWKNGTLEKTIFKADDDQYYITAASRSPDGKTLIEVAYTNPEDRNDSLPTKIYYY